VEAAIMAGQENFRPAIKKLRTQTNVSQENKKASREGLRVPNVTRATLGVPYRKIETTIRAPRRNHQQKSRGLNAEIKGTRGRLQMSDVQVSKALVEAPAPGVEITTG
jgi:hypothetical protein